MLYRVTYNMFIKMATSIHMGWKNASNPNASRCYFPILWSCSSRKEKKVIISHSLLKLNLNIYTVFIKFYIPTWNSNKWDYCCDNIYLWRNILMTREVDCNEKLLLHNISPEKNNLSINSHILLKCVCIWENFKFVISMAILVFVIHGTKVTPGNYQIHVVNTTIKYSSMIKFILNVISSIIY